MGSYTALYRKFRPDNFADVKGQDHIVTTLKNQLAADRIGHAYLFTGTRGTGKTTVAKIFARAVNCENPTEYGPCGECPTCRAITNGSSMNVIEIDAASNNGVDNIREIIDQVSYRPTEGKYKVYIIDEVHMLSTGAFNAMLKTLEEPPEYVIFILATTEVHKLPITVLSRCQRYDFRRISIDTIAARLSNLMEQEGVKVEEKAIRYIAKTADGSLRDALSLLDQCIAFHLGEELTYDMALDVLGAVDTVVFSRLLRSCLEENVHEAIEILDEVITQGRELTQFIVDFTWYLRNLMLVQTSDGLEDVVDMSSDNLVRLKEEAQMAKREQIIRFIHIFSDLSNQIRYATQKRVLVEIALIRLCKPAMDQDNSAILGRINSLEKQLEDGVVVRNAEGVTNGESHKPLAPTPKQVLPKSIPDDVKKIVTNWRQIIGNFSNDLPIANALERAKPSLDNGGNLMIKFDEGDLSSERISEEPGRSKLQQCLNDVTGKEITFSVSVAQSEEEYHSGTIDLRDVIKMEIDEEEE